MLIGTAWEVEIHRRTNAGLAVNRDMAVRLLGEAVNRAETQSRTAPRRFRSEKWLEDPTRFPYSFLPYRMQMHTYGPRRLVKACFVLPGVSFSVQMDNSPPLGNAHPRVNAYQHSRFHLANVGREQQSAECTKLMSS